MTPRLAFIALLLLAACKSSETIPTRAHPEGEEIKCVGISEKGKRPGIDYDWSLRNTVWAVIGSELLFIPPLVVLHHEFYCPIADTTTVVPKVAP